MSFGNLKKLITQLPVQIILTIILAVFLAPILNEQQVHFAYSISNVIKSALMVFLPIVTFAYIFYSMLKFAKSAPLLIGLVLGALVISNGLAVSSAYWLSSVLIPKFIGHYALEIKSMPVPDLASPDWWSPKNGMIFGLVLGIIMSFLNISRVSNFAVQLKDFATLVLQRVFIPFIPLFIFGLVLKLQAEGAIGALLAGYGKVVLFMTIVLFAYLFIFALITHLFNVKKTIVFFKDCSSAMITAFTTMSSIASMPLMFGALKKHIKNEDYVNFIVPGTINIHLVGDSIVFGINIFALIYFYNAPMPTLSNFLVFLYFYCLSRFSVAGVPAGSTLITIPIVQRYLGFSDEMIGVFATVCILQDVLITLGNVTGNCIFAKVTYQLFGGLLPSKDQTGKAEKAQ